MTSDVTEVTKMALEKMDKKYCELSQIDYSKVYEDIREYSKGEKYLERPFAYEFYHQLRKLIDSGAVDFGDRVIQAEVDKRYQHCFDKGKIPDFIIHIADRNDKNFAVLEFKLTSNIDNIEEEDFKKLVEFKKLKYEHIMEVIIGSESSLKEAKGWVNELRNNKYEEITIIGFDTESWKADDWGN